MADTIKLIDVIQAPGNFNWRYALFLPQKKWQLDTQCLVLDPDDVDNPDDPDDNPRQAKDLGFDYVLMIQDIDSIYENAKSQKPGLTATELLDAFMFYYKNDAFITF